jgi:hypothetical protein
MRYARRFGLAAVLSILGLSCDALGLGGSVQVRMENASNVTLSRATLFASEGPQAFQNLSPGEATPYVEVSKAYRIATTEVIVGADTLRLQVIDFVGEEPLGPGRYTYVLVVSELANGDLEFTQQFREDS